MGGRFGGYGLYLLKGKPVFVYNLLDLKRYRWEGGVGARRLAGRSLEPASTPSCSTSSMTAPDLARAEPACSLVDGKRALAARRWITRFRSSCPLTSPSTSVIDTRTPVDESYTLPFRFTGTIDKLTYNIKPEQLTAADQAQKRQALAAAQDTPAK